MSNYISAAILFQRSTLKRSHWEMFQEIVILEIPKRKLAKGFVFSNVVCRERVSLDAG